MDFVAFMDQMIRERGMDRKKVIARSGFRRAWPKMVKNLSIRSAIIITGESMMRLEPELLYDWNEPGGIDVYCT